MTLPEPPGSFDPHILPIAPGTVMHRIHDARFAADIFNPGLGNPGLGASRFAPFQDAGGASVPTAYAATSFDCAASETIFHDIDHGAAFKSVPMLTVERLHYSTLRANRGLRLASLFEPDLNRLGCTRGDLIDTPRSAWPQTRAWASAFHRLCPGIDGLLWTSRRRDQHQAMVLFGDRVGRADIAIVHSEHIASSSRALGALQRLARRSGIVLTY